MSAAGPSLEQMAAEAEALTAAAASDGLLLQAVGGIGVWQSLPGELRAVFAAMRPVPGDLDLLAPLNTSASITEVFAARGYLADERLIAWHGKHRHRYHRPDLGIDVDVFLGTPPSCHELDIRLDPATGGTVSPTDLVLQKLQIHESNRKDLLDLALLLAGTDVDAARVGAALSDSWGFYHSATLNLDHVIGAPPDGLPAPVAAAAAERAASLRDAIEAAPKSRRWRMRARVGTRVQWYTDVEELDR